MSILTPEPGLLFWMLLTFGIVFFILGKYAFPYIIKSIDERKAFIEKSLEDARKAEEQLIKAKETGESLILEAQASKEKILREAAEQKERMLAEAREAALAEGRRLTEQARKDAEAERQKALRSLHNEMAFLTVQMTEMILRRELKATEEQQALIDRYLNEMENKSF
jgi:F-type H+-transporting ATPase subunit b